MLRQLGQWPDPDKIRVIRNVAELLSLFLELELVRLNRRQSSADELKQIYDSVYLPTACKLADEFSGHGDLAVLCQPLCVELASTQVGIVLELLCRITAALRKD